MNTPKFFIFLLAVLASRSTTTLSQTIRHPYRFFDNFSVSAPECGLPLTAIQAAGNCGASTTAGEFVTDVLPQCGLSRTVYSTNLHWGLSYPNQGGTVTDNYTIHIYVKNTNWGTRSWSRIIDFSNGTSDAGIYYKSTSGSNDRCLDFYPNGIVGACPYFKADTYYLLTFTRNAATGIIDVYVNNNKFVSYNDAAKKYVGTAGVPILIYRDDQAVVCESAAANIAYLSFTNEYSNQATVDAVYKDICVIANNNNAADFTATTSGCNLPQDVTVTYTGSLPPGGAGYLAAWNWEDGAVISGTGLGPYVVRYDNEGVKKISLNITNFVCATSLTKDQEVVINSKVTSTINKTICQGQSYEGYTVPGTYTDIFPRVNGCDSTRILHLTMQSPVSTTIHQQICEGQSYEGYDSPGVYTDNFQTDGGCDSIRTLHLSISGKTQTTIRRVICTGQAYEGYTSTGIYQDTFPAANGCDSIRTLELSVQGETTLVMEKTICQGESFEGYSVSGTFTDKYSSVNGCDSTRILKLTVRPAPTVNLGQDQSICIGDSLLLKAGIHDSYTWQDGSQSAAITVRAAGLYAVKVSNSCGIAEDFINITTTNCDIAFPTGFTPNGDGLNDQFRLLRTGRPEIYHLQVFNRWGQQVFETTDPSKGWDGRLGARPAEAGIYAWRCTIKKEGRQVSYKGLVTLLR